MKEKKMKKLIIIVCLILTLTACSVSSKNENNTKNQDISSQKKDISLIVPPTNEGYSKELIDYVREIIRKNPSIGEDGKLSMNYTDATYTINEREYAVFVLLNRSQHVIDQSINFKLNWSYDGQVLFENQEILYNHTKRGDLDMNCAALMMIGITPAQKQIIDSMKDPNKMKLEILVSKG